MTSGFNLVCNVNGIEYSFDYVLNINLNLYMYRFFSQIQICSHLSCIRLVVKCLDFKLLFNELQFYFLRFKEIAWLTWNWMMSPQGETLVLLTDLCQKYLKVDQKGNLQCRLPPAQKKVVCWDWSKVRFSKHFVAVTLNYCRILIKEDTINKLYWWQTEINNWFSINYFKNDK